MTGVGIYIYMLRCADGSYYVGSATGHDLSTRIDQHNAGSYPGYTLSRRPVLRQAKRPKYPTKTKDPSGGTTGGIKPYGRLGGWALAPNTASMGRDNRSHR